MNYYLGKPLPSSAQTADAFNMSGSSFRRKLSAEGLSFSKIREKLLNDKACDLLLNTEMTLGNISDHLGYSDLSSFSRVFKDWHGTSPGTYRQQTTPYSIH